MDRLALLIVMGFIYLISPSFYLLADRRFRDVLSQHGVVKALWSLLKQKYDWEENQKIKIPRFDIAYKNSKDKGPKVSAKSSAGRAVRGTTMVMEVKLHYVLA